jgi:hypothetical protein
MSGAAGSLTVAADTFFDGSGPNFSSSTRYRIRYPSLGLGIHLRPQSRWERLFTLLGSQDIETGSADLDRRFVVEGSDPDRVLRFLTAGRIAALNELSNHYHGIVVTDDGLYLQTLGMENNTNRLFRTVRRLMEAARVLTAEAPAVETLEESPAARVPDGDLPGDSPDV